MDQPANKRKATYNFLEDDRLPEAGKIVYYLQSFN